MLNGTRKSCLNCHYFFKSIRLWQSLERTLFTHTDFVSNIFFANKNFQFIAFLTQTEVSKGLLTTPKMPSTNFLLKNNYLHKCKCLVATINSVQKRPLSRVSRMFDSDDEYRDPESEFKPKKFLLLRKITRYEYEKQLAQTDSDDVLKFHVSWSKKKHAFYNLT